MGLDFELGEEELLVAQSMRDWLAPFKDRTEELRQTILVEK